MKHLFKIALLIVVVATLVSCAAPAAPAPAANAPAPAQGANQPANNAGAKLTVWDYQDQWGKSRDYNLAHLDEFKKLHPNVTVEFVHIPYAEYEAKYLTAFAGRSNAPDVFMGKVAYYGGAIGVADVAPDDVQKTLSDHVVDVISPFYKISDKWYGIPVSADFGMMLYYNTDMFKEAGLDPAKPPKTLAELEDYAKKLTVRDASGKITRSGFSVRYSGAPTGIADKALPFIHAFGGRVYSPDSKTATSFLDGQGTIDGLTYFQNLVTKDKVASLELDLPETQFGAGKAAMVYREGWLVGWLAANAPTIHYAVSPMAEGPGGYPGLSLFFSHSWMVNKFSPNKDLAWDWVRTYLTAQRDWDLAQLEGYNPVFKENLARTEVTSRPDWTATKYIMDHPAGPYYDNQYINEISTRLGQAIQAMIQGSDVKTELGKATTDVNKLLNKK
jgi:multiple sugar transport system substrate-binding protein